MTAEVAALASRIKLLLMDVDGVLTDGKLYNVPDPAGQMVETKGFDSQDGIALQWLNWITGGLLLVIGCLILVSLALPRGWLHL